MTQSIQEDGWVAHLDQFNLTLTAKQEAQFDQYADLIQSWNQKINLTRISERRDIEIRHFLDSLSFSLFLDRFEMPDRFKLIDIGTGAGLPGVPIKMVYPSIAVTCADSVGKKTTFLKRVGDTLGLRDFHVIHERAEAIGRAEAHREAYDVVVARSVAYMSILAEYLLPLCKPGGYVVAFKGSRGKDEVSECLPAIETLGGTFRESLLVELPEIEEPHYLMVIEKTGITPTKYPRKAGIPTKRPLT